MTPHGQTEFIDVDLRGDDRPMPADVELVVRREDALVEHLERRFEQRRTRTLQDHRALLRKGRCYRPFGGATLERQLDQCVRPGRCGCERNTGHAGLAEEMATGECVASGICLHLYSPSLRRRSADNLRFCLSPLR